MFLWEQIKAWKIITYVARNELLRMVPMNDFHNTRVGLGSEGIVSGEDTNAKNKGAYSFRNVFLLNRMGGMTWRAP